MCKPIFLIILVLASISIWAQDVLPCTAVVNAPLNQISQVIVTDGAGGAIVAWMDARTGNYRVYAQRVSPTGTMLWGLNGILVATDPSPTSELSMVSDGVGGAIVGWQDSRGGNDDIYVQRLTSIGSMDWTVNGLEVCANTFSQSSPKLATDGAEGAYVTWSDSRAGEGNIYIQHINAAGGYTGTFNGTLLTDTSEQKNPEICEDGTGGAIITYQQLYPTVQGWDIYAQRVNATCSILWQGGGVPICIAAYEQTNQKLINDGVGSAIIVWQDKINSTQYNVYAQRVYENAISWTANGVLLTTAQAFDQINPVIVRAGLNSAIIVWQDFRSDTNYDIYAQKISGTTSFTIGWNAATAVPVCIIQGSNQMYPQAVADGLGGAIIVWQDGRNLVANGYDIYGQHLDAGGGIVGGGAVGGYGICTEVDNQEHPMITYKTAFEAGYAWMDYRSHSNYDIYTLGVDTNLPVELSAFTAVLTAENYVNLTWVTQSESGMLGYNIYRNSESSYATATKLTQSVISANNSSTMQTYQFIDNEVEVGNTYYYWLEGVDFSGSNSLYGPLSATLSDNPVEPALQETAMDSNYPNPFRVNDKTNINVRVKTGTTATVNIFNILGQNVKTFSVNEGTHTLTWNGKDNKGNLCGSGVYFYKLTSPTASQTRKMIILK